jgi:adenine-specific DNA-methyltransferase
MKDLTPLPIDPTEKWLRFFDGRQGELALPSLVRLDYYGGFSRGIATGANEFFGLSSDAAAEYGLPRSSLVRCITKSSQVRTLVLTDDDLERLERNGARVMLFDANGARDPADLRYVKHGESHGYHLRYLTRTKTPWYRLERRAPAPILFGVFSRNGYKVIRNLSHAITLTCYHGFQPNCFGAELLDELFLYLQSRAGRRILELSMRQYGDGLGKFEPHDLNQSLAPSPKWFSRLSKATVAEAIEACKNNRSLTPELEDIFDSLLRQGEP